MPSFTSSQIFELIRARHAEDLVVGECKNGPTHYADGLLKLDAWVMRRSWSHFATIGYEIKVSRNDWLRDKKWIGYTALTHEFYLVSPREIVQPEELPEGVGLLWVTGTGTKLITKRKAVHREIETPLSLLIYVLMCRATIDAPGRWDKGGDWKQFFEQEHDDRRFGMLLNRKIGETFRRRVLEVASENERLKKRMEELEPLETELRRRGLWSLWNTETVINKLFEVVPSSFVEQLDRFRRDVNDMLKTVERLNAESVVKKKMETEDASSQPQ